MEININCDLGEKSKFHSTKNDPDLLKIVNSANIACGYHAGDPTWMRRTVEDAKKHGVTIGGHPGFPDILGFGRRVMNISPEEGRDYTVYQLGALKGFADTAGLYVEAAKPHSAFYDWAQLSEVNARAMLEGFQAINPNMVAYLPALPTWPLVEIAEQMGLRVVKEFYSGLGYLDDGNLTYVADLSVEETVERTMKFVTEGKTATQSGGEIEFEAESVAVSGESMKAPEILRGLREAFAATNIEIKSALLA